MHIIHKGNADTKVYMYMHIHIYIHIYVYIYICIHLLHIYTCICICKCAHIHTHTNTNRVSVDGVLNLDRGVVKKVTESTAYIGNNYLQCSLGRSEKVTESTAYMETIIYRKNMFYIGNGAYNPHWGEVEKLI